MQQIYTGLNNQLTPEQNCIAMTKTLKIIGSSTVAQNTTSFPTTYSYYPLGYDLLSIQPLDGSSPIFTSAPFISWNFANSQFNVLGITGLTDGVPYSITIRVWWGQIINQ